LSTVAAKPSALPAHLVERHYTAAIEQAPHLRGLLSHATFREALERSVASRFRGEKRAPAESEIVAYLESLNLPDLALACACAEGHEAAWEHFILHYRPELYAAARSLGGVANPQGVADSLYAELYGLEVREGRRRSLFTYFHGRSRLGTWLRAVLAQRHVDAIRAARRTVSLDQPGASGEDSAGEGFSRAAALPDPRGVAALETGPDRERLLAILQAALQAALAALDARDRLRLSYYYAQDLTLAQIGRLMNEHEATVSRKLERIRAGLRQRIEKALREEKRLSAAQVKLCYEYAREEWPFDLMRALQEKESPSF
jgi:RNA polymerase sigma-70 factor